MESKLNRLSATKVELEVELAEDDFSRFYDAALSMIGARMEIKGFRKGAAPKNMVEDKAGSASVLAEAAEEAIARTYPAAVRKENLEPLGRPDIQIMKMAKGNPFIYKALVFVIPEVKLPDYLEIAKKQKKEKVSVSPEEVEKTIEWIRKSRADFSVKEGAAEKGDLLEVEYKIILENGTAVSEEPIKDNFILGEAKMIPGFEKSLEGMKSGESKNGLEFTVPEDFPQRQIAGKKIKVDIEVKSARKRVLPELNEEFAKNVGNFSDLDELRANIKNGLLQEKELEETEKFRQEILDKISEKSETEIPEILRTQEKERMMDSLKHEVKDHMKIPFEQYLSIVKKTEKDLEEHFSKEADRTVKNYLVLKEIAKVENIVPTSEEVEEEINRYMKDFKDEDEHDHDHDANVSRLKSYAEENLRGRKTLDMLEKLSDEN